MRFLVSSSTPIVAKCTQTLRVTAHNVIRGSKGIWTEDIASCFEVGGGRGGGAKIKMPILIFS